MHDTYAVDWDIAHQLCQTAFLILDEVIKVVNRRGKSFTHGLCLWLVTNMRDIVNAM